MEKVKALKETIDTFVECVNGVKDVCTAKDLTALERKAVRALQLAEVQIAEAGDDLYITVLNQRRAINSGNIAIKTEEQPKTPEPVAEVETPKAEPETEEKPKKTTRKKKTTKKAE